MQSKKLMLLMLGALTALTSCKKEEFNPSTINDLQSDAVRLIDFFADNNAAAKQNFTIDALYPVLIEGNKGTMIQFNANSFEDAVGNPIIGNVDIELIEIYGKKDILFLNKQTLGDENGNLSPLISGGEFMLNVTQNGNDVFLKQGYNYKAIVQAPNDVDPNMKVFYQNSDDDILTWAQADTSLIWGGDREYTVYFDSLGWVNCDYFMDQAGSQTSVSVNVPNGFDNTNCAVFISFDGYNSLTSINEYSNINFITGNNYTIPEGSAVHFVVVSFINNIPHSAIVPATIGANHIEVINDLTATTQSQLAMDIQNLP